MQDLDSILQQQKSRPDPVFFSFGSARFGSILQQQKPRPDPVFFHSDPQYWPDLTCKRSDCVLLTLQKHWTNQDPLTLFL